MASRRDAWLALVPGAPRPALLASDEPSARLVAMTAALGASEDDAEVRGARQTIIADPAVRALVVRLLTTCLDDASRIVQAFCMQVLARLRPMDFTGKPMRGYGFVASMEAAPVARAARSSAARSARRPGSAGARGGYREGEPPLALADMREPWSAWPLDVICRLLPPAPCRVSGTTQRPPCLAPIA